MLEAFLLLNCPHGASLPFVRLIMSSVAQICDAEPVSDIDTGFGRFLFVANALAFPKPHYPVAPAPLGWEAVPVINGVTAYLAPEPTSVVMAPEADGVGSSQSATDGESACGSCDTSLNGTRHPYISDISLDNLLNNEIAPGKYVWTGLWEGEGYGRDWDASGQLVAAREGGSDIQISVLYDATATDSTQPNLIITVENHQDQTAQLTDLSAFLIDPDSGKILERKDFGQLPPIYDVILTKAEGFGGVDIQTLEPRAMVSFLYHVAPENLSQHFPMQLQGINQREGDRLWDIQQLESQGWIVQKVPPPVQGDRRNGPLDPLEQSPPANQGASV